MSKHALTDDPARFPMSSYLRTVRSLSDRVVAAQRPLRVLPAIHWDASIEAAFFATAGRELPPVTAETYRTWPLPFEPESKFAEIRAIEADVDRLLGRQNLAGTMLRRRCEEYREVVGLLTSRGTPAFATAARQLYDVTPAAVENRAITALFAALAPGDPTRPENLRKIFGAAEAVALLADRLRSLVPLGDDIRVKVCDRIVSDAAAGCGYVKLRERAVFSVLDLALLEYHEGWVHLGTTLNGRRQPVLTVLAKGPPSTAATQEGLAVLCELLAGVCHAGRLARLWRRTQAVRMAEAGANFLDVYRFFLASTDDPRDSYRQTVRVYRGSVPDGAGPFPKDLCYAVGLHRVVVALTAAAAAGRGSAGRLVFAGKTALAEFDAITRLHAAGFVALPDIVPPPFLDRQVLRQRLALLQSAKGRFAARTEISAAMPLAVGPAI